MRPPPRASALRPADSKGLAERGRTGRLTACLLGAALALVALVAAAAPLQGRTLVVGSEQNYPPFAIGMTDDTADGFTVALWKAVAREQRLDYTIRVRPFDELLQGFKSGSIDVLINLAQSDERRRFADFSVTHVAVGGAIFVRHGDRRVRSEADLAGKSVIVLKADLAHDYAIGKGWQAQLVLADTAEQGLRLLASGRHDAMLISKLAGLQTIRSQGIPGLEALDVGVGFSQRFAFAVRKGDAELLARVNEGLALAKTDGDYDRLYEKWFGVYEVRQRGLRDVWPWLAAAGLIVAASWAITFRNRRRRDRRAADSLRESEERWKFALEGAGDGVWDADLSTGTTLYSRRWKEILGYADGEIGTGADEWSKRIHPDDLRRVLDENQACLAGQTDGFFSEFRMRAKDGGWVWILDRGKVVRRSADGKALRMIGTHADISERKEAQAREAAHAGVMALIATGASLPVILESIVRGVESLRDWQCSILLLDATGERLLTAAAPSLPDFYNHAIDGLRIGADVGSCGTAAYTGTRVVSEDVRTDPRWAGFRELAEKAGLRACWSEPILGEGGIVLGSFATYHRRPRVPSRADMDHIAETAQIASVAIERKRGEQALRSSEERLQRALNASQLALWDLDLTTGSVYLSNAWSEMLGGPGTAVSTTFDALTVMVPDEDQPRIAAAMSDALRGLTPDYSVEHRVRRPDGQVIWVLSQGRVVERTGDGRAVRAVGTNRDITERKRAETTQRLLESQLREAQKLEAIGTLASGIAHDFNNIMAAILGNVAFARQDVGKNHPAQGYLEQINKAGLRARSLVQQILAFSRKQANEFVGQSPRPMVEETVMMLRSVVGASVQLSAVLPERKFAVMANLTQMQQVLMNLGTNAWQALPGGAGHIEIGLGETVFVDDGSPRPAGLAPGPYAHLWVRDDGCGMDEHTRQHIFEPFFTTKPVGQGTGLGLAVVHGIVEAHGGAITVTTAVGRGSTFSLYLPLIDYESRPMPLETIEAKPLRGHGEHVLYVDDDEVMGLMVHGLLERLGYRATCTLDAREAIALVERDPQGVDLVVTDYNMPNCSGLDVARALARIRPGLPVAISSGYVSDELRASASELGVLGVMQKEHTLEELGSLVHSALAARAPDRHR
ncbi:PAS domain-containing protein [Methylibium sp.]|uniref:PAS domain-containing protein n=1 Tax=Methylibium sp. TaxID=2067992 RepID=UPI003D0F724C